MYRGNENAKTAHWLSEHKHPCIILVYGKSLSPVIKSAQPVVVEPIDDNCVIGKDDIVFCRVQKRYRLQKVILVEKPEWYSVGNAHGYINGTIGRKAIYGRAVRILRRKKFDKKG
ncbi:MAG: hypothetical protein K2H90_00010 [Oscillospiraceae bacterium]|nr:hypothetical protein [Oscillospiraceae bacterium]